MIVMPIINKNRNNEYIIYNVEVSLKNIKKVKEEVNLDKCSPSDILINGNSYNKSIYSNDREEKSIVDFIRNSNHRIGKRNFLITTNNYHYSKLYDVYDMELPPRKISSAIDNLYGSIYLDLKNERPDEVNSTNISLKELGFNNNINEEKIERLKDILNKTDDINKIKDLMKINGISDLYKIIDILSNFDFTIISKSKINDDDFKIVLNAFENINSKEFKVLNNYYNIAMDNMEVYAKLTKINKLLYKKPIKLIKNKKTTKTLVKAKDINEAA